MKKETLKEKEQNILLVGKYAFADMKRMGVGPLDNQNKIMSEEEYLDNLLMVVRNDHFRGLKSA